MEVRVDRSRDTMASGQRRFIEVCIDDQWYEAISGSTLANTSQALQNGITFNQVDSTSLMINWSEVVILPNSQIIGEYDLSCTIFSPSDGLIKEVKISNISASDTKVLVNGLLPDMTYNCCLNAHIQTNTMFNLISSNCSSVKTTVDEISSCDDSYIGLGVGLGTGLGIGCLLLAVLCMTLICIIVCQMTNLNKEPTKKKNELVCF